MLFLHIPCDDVMGKASRTQSHAVTEDVVIFIETALFVRIYFICL